MENGLYHIENNKIYKMSLNEPMRKIGTVASDEVIMSIIDTVPIFLIRSEEHTYELQSSETK